MRGENLGYCRRIKPSSPECGDGEESALVVRIVVSLRYGVLGDRTASWGVCASLSLC